MLHLNTRQSCQQATPVDSLIPESKLSNNYSIEHAHSEATYFMETAIAQIAKSTSRLITLTRSPPCTWKPDKNMEALQLYRGFALFSSPW